MAETTSTPTQLTCLQCGEPSERPLHPGCSRLWVSAKQQERQRALRDARDADRIAVEAAHALVYRPRVVPPFLSRRGMRR